MNQIRIDELLKMHFFGYKIGIIGSYRFYLIEAFTKFGIQFNKVKLRLCAEIYFHKNYSLIVIVIVCRNFVQVQNF